MELHCAICYGKKEARFACHHCGRPLCDHAGVCHRLIRDPAFADHTVYAYHCPDCASHIHPSFNLFAVLWRWLQKYLRILWEVLRP